MDMTVLTEVPFKIDYLSISRKLHIEPSSDEYEELAELLNKAAAVAKPKALFKPVFIEEKANDFVVLDGVKMLSTVMPKNLEGLHRIFAYVATCGIEMEHFSQSETDMLYTWWLSTIMEDALGQAVAALRQRIKRDFDIKKMASMSPGSLPDWPISEQTKLFSLFGNVEELIGVKLTDSMLMIPAKSVSGFYFETDTDYVNCQLCQRQNCPSRRLPFDEKKSSLLLGS